MRRTSSRPRSAIHRASRGAYGAPRVHAALRRKGHAINRKRVERIMRERDIRGVTRRRRRHLTQQDSKAAPAPDLVGRDFTERPGTKLVGDITYLPTIEGWWYLATVIDLATREVIGYAMADHHRAELVTDALCMAAGRGGLQPGCIMHTDHCTVPCHMVHSRAMRLAREVPGVHTVDQGDLCRVGRLPLCAHGLTARPAVPYQDRTPS
ncbi:IS3 family transposase [Streptomyces sp. R-74717]